MRMSVDDACASDVRVAELADKYKVDCVFYWPVEWHSLAYEKGYEPLTFEKAESIALVHEIGSHTVTHRHLTRIPYQEAVQEIVESKYILQAMFGVKVEKFCPPRGYTNAPLTELTLENYASQRLTRGRGLVHVHPDSGANDNRPWRSLVTPDSELWAHSWELDRFNLWEQLEDCLRDMA